MANSKSSHRLSNTIGTFTGTVDDKPITATTVFAGTANEMVYVEFDEEANENLTSIMFHLSAAFYDEPQPVTVQMTNKRLYAYFRDNRGLRRPVVDGELHINMNREDETYTGHFDNLVFGLYDDPTDKVTISGKFTLKGHTDPFEDKSGSFPQKDFLQKDYPRTLLK